MTAIICSSSGARLCGIKLHRYLKPRAAPATSKKERPLSHWARITKKAVKFANAGDGKKFYLNQGDWNLVRNCPRTTDDFNLMLYPGCKRILGCLSTEEVLRENIFVAIYKYLIYKSIIIILETNAIECRLIQP